MTWQSLQTRVNTTLMERFGEPRIKMGETFYDVIELRRNMLTEAGYQIEWLVFLDAQYKAVFPLNSLVVLDGENYIVREPRIEDGLLVLELKRA
ncbi:hypothetical protein [Pleionea sediminis]|uniref:hypothetical protein n=1 Tax=Pleionea sediminis TaxID=2569479 RepID=UPI001185D9DF|nr:hypothetical protein [Pleionea sediminis]